MCLALKSGECSVLQRKELDGAGGLGTVTLRVMMMMLNDDDVGYDDDGDDDVNVDKRAE